MASPRSESLGYREDDLLGYYEYRSNEWCLEAIGAKIVQEIVIYFPCRHYVYELVLKSIFEAEIFQVKNGAILGFQDLENENIVNGEKSKTKPGVKVNTKLINNWQN